MAGEHETASERIKTPGAFRGVSVPCQDQTEEAVEGGGGARVVLVVTHGCSRRLIVMHGRSRRLIVMDGRSPRVWFTQLEVQYTHV